MRTPGNTEPFGEVSRGRGHLLSLLLSTVAATGIVMLTRFSSLGAEAPSQTPGRQFIDSFERAVDVSVPQHEIASLIDELKTIAPTWVAADQTKTVARRQTVALAVLELAARMPHVVTRPRSPELEWACEFIRKGNAGQFERVWMLASASLMGKLPFPTGPLPPTHLKHARELFPSDPELQLAEILLRTEAVTVVNTPRVDSERLAGYTGYGQTNRIPRPMNMTQTARLLQALSADSTVGPEATMRLGLVEFLRGQVGPSMDHFQSAAQRASDPYVKNLAWLMHGLALEAQGSPADALKSYRASVDALPSIAAGTAFAVALFLSGERAEASSVLEAVYGTTPAIIDPWSDSVGSQRHFAKYVNDMRAILGLPPRRPDDIPNEQRVASVAQLAEPASSTGVLAAPDNRQVTFRTSTDSVIVDVAVLDRKVPVRGLTVDDFDIFDNGVRQTIDASDIAQVPLDVTIVLEMNDPSINRVPWQPATAIEDALRIARLLTPLDRLRLLVAGMDGPMDAVSLRPAPTADLRNVRLSPLAISGQNTSTLFDATAAALIASVPPDRRGLVLIFTDGIDGASVLKPEQVLAVARQSESVAYAARRYAGAEMGTRQRTGFIDDTGELRHMLRPISPTMIENVVEATGGILSHPTQNESVAKFFDQVLASFRERYLFHYTPTGVPAKGWHTITVKLKKPGRFTVAARKGYLGGR